jgi:N-acetylmuramoyl-L-alanine amidase
VALGAVALAALGVERPPGLGDVVEVRHWSYPDYTRVVVELSRPAETEVHELPADPKAGKPHRLYFDVPGVWVGRSYEEPIPVADGLLRGVRVGQYTLTTTRVVLDLERYERHRLLSLESPYRLVIDVYGERRDRPAPAPTARGALPMELRPIRTIVVDAGHGGRDPGAIGLGGLREKQVTLALALALRQELEARGFEVVLTRDRDRTLSLVERTALAEGAGGDVFVSIHANAAPHHSANGVEIYTLDENSERQTLRLAARENGVAPREVDPLQRLLARLRLSETSERSLRVATLVHHQIVADMGPRWPSVKGPGLKHGPFYVLYLSDMPSILVEAGFLTHRQDARRLRDPVYLRAMAAEIADGLAQYRDRSAPVVAGREP